MNLKSGLRPPGRKGLVTETVFDARHTFEAQYQVIERERVGKFSRVRIVGLSGVPWSFRRDAKALLPEWIPTAKITWLAEDA